MKLTIITSFRKVISEIYNRYKYSWLIIPPFRSDPRDHALGMSAGFLALGGVAVGREEVHAGFMPPAVGSGQEKPRAGCWGAIKRGARV